MAIFDNKNFNAQVFGQYIDRIPNLTRNRMISSGAIRMRNDLATSLKDDVGGNFISTPLLGLVNGDPVNYDGGTDITVSSTVTYMHDRIVIGRAKGFKEKDFSYDITGGVDFMANIAQQIADYWNTVYQKSLISCLKGVFSMSDTAGAAFVNAHTMDVTANAAYGNVGAGCIGDTTMNDATQKACGDNKDSFSLAIMHSVVATHLENLKLLAYMKSTDAQGIERELALATLNGKAVLIDDGMPVASVNLGTEESPNIKTAYYTYVLGNGAIELTECGAKVPYEMDRDPKTNGGEDILYTRRRFCFAPYGINFTKSSMASLSPEPAELELGANWELVNTGGSNKQYIDHKSIPIAQIISLG